MHTKCGILTQNLEKHFKIKNPETLGFISFPWISGLSCIMRKMGLEPTCKGLKPPIL